MKNKDHDLVFKDYYVPMFVYASTFFSHRLVEKPVHLINIVPTLFLLTDKDYVNYTLGIDVLSESQKEKANHLDSLSKSFDYSTKYLYFNNKKIE